MQNNKLPGVYILTLTPGCKSAFSSSWSPVWRHGMVTQNGNRMLVSFKAMPTERRPSSVRNRWIGMLVSLEPNVLGFQKKLFTDCFVAENT